MAIERHLRNHRAGGSLIRNKEMFKANTQEDMFWDCSTQDELNINTMNGLWINSRNQK
jgi:hypothetical protein